MLLFNILKGLAIVLVISMFGGLVLAVLDLDNKDWREWEMLLAVVIILLLIVLTFALCAAGADESGSPRSILYDDPEYFKHEEPKWMRREEDDEE